MLTGDQGGLTASRKMSQVLGPGPRAWGARGPTVRWTLVPENRLEALLLHLHPQPQNPVSLGKLWPRTLETPELESQYFSQFGNAVPPGDPALSCGVARLSLALERV